MGQNFIAELLQNVANEQALSEGLDKLAEANKDAYRQAISNLENYSQDESNSDAKYVDEDSKLQSLLRHLS